MIKYRLAKSSDAKLLTKVHLICAKHQKGGFFHNLGFYFTLNYYKILLSNKNTIILIAEDQQQNLLGFHSGTLKMEEQIKDLKRNKFILGMATLPKLLVNPRLIHEIIIRYFSISDSISENDFGVTSGARGEYWCWLPSNSNSIEALSLWNKWFNVLKELGVTNLFFEVDTINSRIVSFHKKNGAKITREINLLDGRKRLIMVYIISKT